MAFRFCWFVWFGRFPGCIGHPSCSSHMQSTVKSVLDVQEFCIVVIDLN